VANDCFKILPLVYQHVFWLLAVLHQYGMSGGLGESLGVRILLQKL